MTADRANQIKIRNKAASLTLTIDRQERFLGHFDTIEEAHAAYTAAALACFGKFARVI
jgi:hypothetical protein